MMRAGWMLFLSVLFWLPGNLVRAQSIVADLSDHLVEVTTGFSGAELLLFGAVEAGGEVVVLVRGPSEVVTVRKKQRIAGVWINRETKDFVGVPSYYSVASTMDLDKLATEEVRLRNEIGVDKLLLRTADRKRSDPGGVFRQALIRNKVRAGLYTAQPLKITFIGKRLFRTDVIFPANVPTGAYTIWVYLLKDGVVKSAQSTPLEVSKVGLGAQIYDFAHEYAAIHGVIAILIALFAGWAAGAIFRRA